MLARDNGKVHTWKSLTLNDIDACGPKPGGRSGKSHVPVVQPFVKVVFQWDLALDCLNINSKIQLTHLASHDPSQQERSGYPAGLVSAHGLAVTKVIGCGTECSPNPHLRFLKAFCGLFARSTRETIQKEFSETFHLPCRFNGALVFLKRGPLLLMQYSSLK